jgi:Zn-dependent protease
MNAGLLFFNLIPVYPLDGGQILRGLLWLRIGPIRSLKAASIIGFGGGTSLCALGNHSAIHQAGHNRVLHFRAGASRLARRSEPRYRIRGGRTPASGNFSAANSRATTLS